VILARTASAPNLEDPTVLDDLLSTSGWQTLVTIARESARTFFYLPSSMHLLIK